MKTYLLTEVDAVRGDNLLLRALRLIRDAINDVSNRSASGRTSLVGGVAVVTIPGLQAGTDVVPVYRSFAGTPGTLRCDPAEHNVEKKTATIRSSSATDTSAVSWVAVT